MQNKNTPVNLSDKSSESGAKSKLVGKTPNKSKLYNLFWVIPRRLNFICRRFETLCLFNLHRQVGMKKFIITYRPMKMEQTECSETSAYKIQTPENYAEEGI